MENSPYKTPDSDLEIPEEFKRAIGWKIYFFFITILSAIGMISFLTELAAGIPEYINLVLWLVATVGLFGFVFLKPIYNRKFWLQVLVTYLVYSVVYYFITDIDLRHGMSEGVFYISCAISWLISVPAFYALYALSRPHNPVWAKRS